MPSAAATATVLRLLGAAALIGLVGVHAALWIGRISDPMAWVVNGALVAIAVCLAMPLARRTAAGTAGPITTT